MTGSFTVSELGADPLKITSRYILKEHVGPLVFALSALTSLMLLNYVAKKFGDLVGKGLHWTVIAEFFALSVPFTVAMTLPMAILVATLHAFSRLASENEITAYKASGVSMHRLLAPVLVAALGFTLAMLLFNDQVLPWANHRLATLTADISRKKPTVAFKEQIINEVSPNRLYLRAGRINRATSMMREVTIYDLTLPQKRRIIHADSGLLEMSANQVDLQLTLFSGSMSEVSLAEPAKLQRNFFRTDFLLVRGVGNQYESESPDSMYKSDREMTICELQTRVERAARTRDSAWQVLWRFDRKTARTLQPDALRSGLGGAYCRLLGALHVQTAGAAELQDTSRKGRKTAPDRPLETRPEQHVGGGPAGTHAARGSVHRRRRARRGRAKTRYRKLRSGSWSRGRNSSSRVPRTSWTGTRWRSRRSLPSPRRASSSCCSAPPSHCGSRAAAWA